MNTDNQDAPVETSTTPFQPFSSFRAAALFWFRFGLAVIPISPGTKQTAVKWDQWLQRLSLRQIITYWNAHPTHEVGFIVGDNAIVFDADSLKAVDALVEAEGRFGVQPSMVVRTKRGEHHYFLKASDLPCKTTSKIVGEACDRIDVKTGRTMVVLPPSADKFLVHFGDQHLERADQMNAAPREFLEYFGALVVSHDAGVPVRAAPIATPGPQTYRLLSAGLSRLSADCDYLSWLRICAIVFHVSKGTEEGFYLLNQWSATGKTYGGERDVRKKWDSFSLNHPHPMTMASLRFMLSEQGHDWYELCAEAEGEAFEVVEMEVQQ